MNNKNYSSNSKNYTTILKNSKNYSLSILTQELWSSYSRWQQVENFYPLKYIIFLKSQGKPCTYCYKIENMLKAYMI